MNIIEELNHIRQTLNINVDVLNSFGIFIINNHQGWIISGPGITIIDYNNGLIHYNTNDTNKIMESLFDRGFNREEITIIIGGNKNG